MAKLPDIGDPTLDAVDAAIEARGNAEPARGYLGMSAVGGPCERRLWYGFRWCLSSSFNAATLRRFEDGHRGEDLMADRLRAVPGITLHTIDPRTGHQFGFRDIGGHLRGHCDGRITGLLQAPKTEAVWEHKNTNEKKQGELTKLKHEKGEKAALAEWDATYHGQAQLYMHYSGLTRHYLTCSSPGERSTVSVRTNADAKVAKPLIERARRIITAQEPPPRISERPDWYECKWCGFHAVCHGSTLPEVNCRTCLHATPELDGDGRWSCARYGCDMPTEYQRQSGECPEHRFIPALLRGCEAVDANDGENWIEYFCKANDAVFRNATTNWTSQELRALYPGLIADPVVSDLGKPSPVPGGADPNPSAPPATASFESDVAIAEASFSTALETARASVPAPWE